MCLQTPSNLVSRLKCFVDYKLRFLGWKKHLIMLDICHMVKLLLGIPSSYIEVPGFKSCLTSLWQLSVGTPHEKQQHIPQVIELCPRTRSRHWALAPWISQVQARSYFYRHLGNESAEEPNRILRGTVTQGAEDRHALVWHSKMLVVCWQKENTNATGNNQIVPYKP